MKIETLHQLFLESTGICTDTRNITKNCLFFSLKGENFNGNKFAQDALDKGAYKVVIDEIGYHKNTGETILCRNSLHLLQKLSSYHRTYLGLPVIALTGSNGKTTTKELINVVLAQKFKTVATKGNLNNHIGVPLTLLSMDKSTEFGIVEMGANHLKEIESLSKIAKPDFGYITNFGKAHLEGFGSIDGVIKGKTELYKYLADNDKIAFINANDLKQVEFAKALNAVTFGNDEQDSYIQLKDASDTLLVNFKGLNIQSNLVGLYNFHNIAAAIAIGDYFNISSEKIKLAIENYTPSNNRSQIVIKNTNKVILDAYNANPTSMLAAIENFKQAKGNNKILFLGDMFELGSEADQEHQKITTFLSENDIGRTYLIGSNFFKTETKADHVYQFQNFDDLISTLDSNPPVNSFILIKASRGMALERILEFI